MSPKQFLNISIPNHYIICGNSQYNQLKWCFTKLQKKKSPSFIVLYIYIVLSSGPPCNTWSVARTKCLREQGQRRGPRAVRSGDALWGLPSLALRELTDVIFGNTLLFFAVTILIHLAGNGGYGLLEHPAEPDELDAASIWKLPIFYLLLEIPGFKRVRFLQGLFGAPSAKPAEFLTLNMPWVLHCLHKGRISVNPPKGGSIGLDREGNFRTAILKEYPPALCKCIAEAFHRSLSCLEDASTADVDSDFIQRCINMTCTEYSHRIGRDFAGT